MTLYTNPHPGIAIQEWGGGALSANHSVTATPVFVGNFITNGG